MQMQYLEYCHMIHKILFHRLFYCKSSRPSRSVILLLLTLTNHQTLETDDLVFIEVLPQIAFLLFGLLELLLPQVVHARGVCVREYELKNITVPVNWVSFDSCLNVL
jgi:hypothetical protein